MAYNPKLVTVTVNGKIATGLRDGDIYKYEETGERYTPYEGVDGEVEYSERAGNPCKLAIGFKTTSPFIAYLNALYNNREDIDVTIVDANESSKETISGTNGKIMQRPDSSRGKEIGEKEFNFHFPSHTVKN